jgi:hypothetical protein
MPGQVYGRPEHSETGEAIGPERGRTCAGCKSCLGKKNESQKEISPHKSYTVPIIRKDSFVLLRQVWLPALIVASGGLLVWWRRRRRLSLLKNLFGLRIGWQAKITTDDTAIQCPLLLGDLSMANS